MISSIPLALLLVVYMVLPKCTSSPLVTYSQNLVRLFHLQVLSIIILPLSFVIFFHLQFLMITLAKILFLLFLKLRMQIFPKIVPYNITSLFTNIPLQETIDVAINLIFNKKSKHHQKRLEKVKKTFPFSYITDSFYF